MVRLRSKRVLVNLSICLTNEYGQVWDLLLLQDKFSYNDRTNRTTSKSPFQVVYGLHPRGVCELRELKSHEEVVDDFV